jgi:hypothetical protein
MLDKTAEATCRITDKISMNTKSIILISIYNTELRDNQTEWRQNDEKTIPYPFITFDGHIAPFFGK